MPLIDKRGGGGSPKDATYLVKTDHPSLPNDVVVEALDQNLAIKGDDAASRTITIGQQVTNPDVIVIDVPPANATLNGSEIINAGDAQTITALKSFSLGTLKLLDGSGTYGFTVRPNSLSQDVDLYIPTVTTPQDTVLLQTAEQVVDGKKTFKDTKLAVQDASTFGEVVISGGTQTTTATVAFPDGISGTHVFVLQDFQQTVTNKDFSSNISFSEAPSLADDVRWTFNPGANNAGINVGAVGSDPASPVDGDLWYNSTEGVLKGQIDGVTVTIATASGAGGGGAPSDAAYLLNASHSLLPNGIVVAALTQNLTIAGDGSASRTITLGQQTGAADVVAIDVPVANATLNGSPIVNESASQTLTNKTLGTGTAVTASIAWADNVRQTFNPGSTVAGINVGSVASDPTSPVNGDLWYNTTTNKLMTVENGVVKEVIAGGGAGGTLDDAYDYGGAGAGRIITADSGPVEIQVPSGVSDRGLYVNVSDTGSAPAFRLHHAGTGAHIAVDNVGEDLRLSPGGAANVVIQSGELWVGPNGYTKLNPQGYIDLGKSSHAYRLTLQASPSQTESWGMIFPPDRGAAGQVLSIVSYSGTSAVLDWVDPPASTAHNIISTEHPDTFNDASHPDTPQEGGIIAAYYDSATASYKWAQHTPQSSLIEPLAPMLLPIIGNETNKEWLVHGIGTLRESTWWEIPQVYPQSVLTDLGRTDAGDDTTIEVKEDWDDTIKQGYIEVKGKAGAFTGTKTWSQVFRFTFPKYWRRVKSVQFRARTSNPSNVTQLIVRIEVADGSAWAQHVASGTDGAWTMYTFGPLNGTEDVETYRTWVVKFTAYVEPGEYVQWAELRIQYGA